MPSTFSFRVTATAGGETIQENLVVTIDNMPETVTIDHPDGYSITFDDGLVSYCQIIHVTSNRATFPETAYPDMNITAPEIACD